jgi:BolA family transcriptional regulator, general stress-responsive regulator
MADDYADLAFPPASLDNAEDTLTAVRGCGLMATMPTKDVIIEKLTEAFAPESLSVVDESGEHEGHAGHRPGMATHFRVYIVARAFCDKSRLERHRMINQALSVELAGGVHALAIHAAAPGEGGI